MMLTESGLNLWHSRFRGAVILFAGAFLSACTPPQPPATPYDPYEAQNRDVHELNKQFDTIVLKPVSAGVEDIIPDPLELGLTNAVDNLEAPGDAVNYILQARPEKAVVMLGRFGINSTLGLLGTIDVAAKLGLERDSTYFGETMHVWGIGEGAYTELPFIGPSTDRDTVGFFAGMYTNPLSLLMTPEQAILSLGLEAVSIAINRDRYSETVDSVLYDSADSYAQTRLLYLQNRRFELGQTTGDDAFLDPYEDPYE